MKALLSDFKTGWFGLSLELSSREIDRLIRGLEELKDGTGQLHFSSLFDGEPGIGDVEVSCSGDSECGDLVLDLSPCISSDGEDT